MLERLEDRTVPATLDVTNGVATFLAAPGEFNDLRVSVASGTYTIEDVNVLIFLTGGAAAAGFTGGGSNSVRGPDASVDFIDLQLGDGGDEATIRSINDPTALRGETGRDQVNVQTTAASLTIIGGDEDDTFNVSSDAPANNGTLDNILGPVSFLGGSGTDSLLVSDAGDTADNSGTLADDLLTGFGLGASLSADEIERADLTLGSGNDSLNVLSSAAGVLYTLAAGAGNDRILVGNAANSLADIQGNLVLDGEDHSPSATVTFSVTCDTTTISNTLPVGDQLILNDQGNAVASNYTFTATSVARDGTATITYLTTESITLHAGSGNDFINVASTAASVNTTINTTAGGDFVGLNTDGANRNVLINGDAAGNTFNVADTGAGSVIIANAAGGRDTLTLTTIGSGSGVQLFGEGGDDAINIMATAASSATVASGGDGNDFITIGSAAGSLDDIQGGICVSGDTNTADLLPAASVTAGGVTVTNQLVDGDDVQFLDVANPNAHTYTLTATAFTRDGIATVFYGPPQVGAVTIERFELLAGAGTDTINVRSTPDLTTTTIDTTAGGDTVNVAATGTNSNTVVLDDDAANAINVGNTGDGGVTLVNASGGSDTVTLQATGAGSGVRLLGGDGSDTLTVLTTGAGSATALGGEANDDTLTVGNGVLEGQVLGAVSVFGGLHDLADVFVLDDDQDSFGNTGSLLDNAVAGLGLSSNVGLDSLENLAIRLGSGDDDFSVIDGAGFGQNRSVSVFGGAGTDTTTIINLAYTVALMGIEQSPVVSLTGGSLTTFDPLLVTGDITANAAAVPAFFAAAGTGSLRLDAARTFQVADGTAFQDLVVTALIADDSGNTPGAVTKAGLGTLVFTADNTYSGGTTVQAGTLLINGQQPANIVNVLGGTLGGNGTVGTVEVSGQALSPGSGGPGRFTVNGGVRFTGVAAFVAELNGTTPGATFDQLDTIGTVELGTQTELRASLGYNAAIGDRLVIITGRVTGTFKDLPEGAIFLIDGETFTITYTGSAVLTRIKADPIVTLLPSLPTSTFGQEVIFTAAVSPIGSKSAPTGFVTFLLDGGTPLGTLPLQSPSLTAALPTATLPAGSRIVGALYSGDELFNQGTVQLPYNIAPAATSTHMESSVAAAVFGQAVTFTASVTPATAVGTVAFILNGTELSAAPLAGGQAFFTPVLNAATHTVRIEYRPANGNFTASGSSPQPFSVARAVTTVAVSNPVNPSSEGQEIVLTATVQAQAPSTATPAGHVVFTIGGIDQSPIFDLDAGGTARLHTSTLAVGTHSVTARYEGTSNFDASSTPSAFEQEVNPAEDRVASTTLLEGPPGGTTPLGTAFTLQATVSNAAGGGPTPTGLVTFRQGTAVVAVLPLSGGQAVYTVPVQTPDGFFGIYGGSYTFTAEYGGNGDYFSSSSASLPHTVTQTDSQAYVDQAFRDLFGRHADVAGLNFWADLFDRQVVPLPTLAASLTHAAEYYIFNVIKPAYLQFLGREADAGGINYWVGQMLAGVTDQQLQASLAGSAEFYAASGGTDRAWVEGLYLGLLDRAGEPSGVDFWTGRIAPAPHGDPAAFTAARIAVALDFINSNERTGVQVQGYYDRFLGRAASDQEVMGWVEAFKRGATYEDIVTGFIASPEYFSNATG